jgi:hypothetical protein
LAFVSARLKPCPDELGRMRWLMKVGRFGGFLRGCWLLVAREK